jgi:hypothetical protein
MKKQAGLFLIPLLLASLISTESASGQNANPSSLHPLSLVLIKSTLTAVNHGNITGNYAVLRELGSPQFRQQNKAADLAATFAELRQQRLDLSPILVSDPQLTRQPVQDAEGRLHLEGICPLAQLAVRFHLVYQTVPQGWLIDQISIQIVSQNDQAMARQ